MRLVVSLALLLLAAPALAQQPRPATCPRDLFQNEAALRVQQTRLAGVANADQATQCKAYREHVGFLQKSRSVFATCQGGAERERNVAEMDGELKDYRALIANRCGGR
ncbi:MULTISPECIES: hypothetical protein [unclassified Bosea (in: a-proteobacteria)]|uniref:hypothetical protein n=1 Tax=unclassified Bosea (in: a-proteobacteria) TaxID=2653178 RepID=UPI000956DA5A|nr:MULTISPECIES: hypothetical protein [unclassified Bosea (in: a-proteobacteria)]TAJ27473.1 MAG: hypothetical protein EPO59_21315 [Bosea sp. (in: a-proteobacteria)]SIR22017.1 hypothetical protein SAMN05880592_11270 [Bosea sp. TND4EK4]